MLVVALCPHHLSFLVKMSKKPVSEANSNSIKISDNYIPSKAGKHKYMETTDEIFPSLKKVSIVHISSPSGTKTLVCCFDQKKG